MPITLTVTAQGQVTLRKEVLEHLGMSRAEYPASLGRTPAAVRPVDSREARAIALRPWCSSISGPAPRPWSSTCTPSST